MTIKLKLLLLLKQINFYIIKNLNNYYSEMIFSFKSHQFSFNVVYNVSPVIFIGNYTSWHYLFLFCIFFTFILFFYFKLYSWCNLSMSFSSFICFFILNCQFFLYLGFFVLLIFYMPDHPILLKDISFFSQFRYLFFSLASIFITFFMLFSFLFKSNFRSYFSSFSFPSPKDEIRLILDSFRPSRFDTLCLYFINQLFSSKFYRFLYYTIYIIQSLIRISRVIVFIGCCFFKGDFRFLLYFAPLAFLSWILSILCYQIEYIIEGNSHFIRELLIVDIQREPLELSSNRVRFYYKLTPKAYTEGFTNDDYDHLVNKWLILGDLSNFLRFRSYVKYISLCILLLYCFAWFFISYVFFFANSFEDVVIESTLLTFLRNSPVWKPRIGFIRNYADTRFVYERHQTPIKLLSNGEFAVGHPVIGDPLPDGSYRIYGFFTRNPAYGNPLLSSPIVPGKKGGTQNAVFFSKWIDVPASYVTPPVPGSEARLNEAGIQAILDHLYKDKKN